MTPATRTTGKIYYPVVASRPGEAIFAVMRFRERSIAFPAAKIAASALGLLATGPECLFDRPRHETLSSMRRPSFLEEGFFFVLKPKKTNSGAEPGAFQWAEGFAAGSIKKTLRTSRRKAPKSKSRLTVLGSSTPVPNVGR